MSHSSSGRRPSRASSVTPSVGSVGERAHAAHERLLAELLETNEDGAPDLLAALLGSIEDELVRSTAPGHTRRTTSAAHTPSRASTRRLVHNVGDVRAQVSLEADEKRTTNDDEAGTLDAAPLGPGARPRSHRKSISSVSERKLEKWLQQVARRSPAARDLGI